MSSIKEGLYKPSLLHTEINSMLSLRGQAENDGRRERVGAPLFSLCPPIIPCMLQLFPLPRPRSNNPSQPKKHERDFCRRERAMKLGSMFLLTY